MEQESKFKVDTPNKTDEEDKLESKQFDSAVQEILDICQSYNERCDNLQSAARKSSFSLKSCNNKGGKRPENDKNTPHITNASNDKVIRDVATPTPPNLYTNLHSCEKIITRDCDINNKSVEHMQAEQSTLQNELDSIMRNQDSIDNNEDDTELAEFQRLENEVRIAELNKKLDTIQEAIRIKLYNQLFSQNSSDSSSNEALSSSSDGGFELNNKHSSASESEASINQSNQSSGIESPHSASFVYSKQKAIGSPKSNYDSLEPVDEEEAQSISNPYGDKSKSAFSEKRADSITPSTYDLTPTTSKESINSSSKQQTADSDDVIKQNGQSLESVTAQCYLDKVYNHQRISSAVGDLARIDEGEEELPELNQQKTSISYRDDVNNRSDDHERTDSLDFDIASPGKLICNMTDAKSSSATETNSKQNRPLTLYLPKPNEELDLIDHVQIMGHDINIISGDIQLSSTRAYGFLWKSCVRSPKKWRKRYFLFDRRSKIIAYYKNERNLVKNECNPSNIIKFDNIIDVYVDHKLSGARAKNPSRNRDYIFVLATKQRNYILASAKAETMRVWIDIMFTAAQSYDYF